MIRAFNRLATALLAACVVLGPPAVAVLWAMRQPWREIRVGEVRAWMADPPDEGLIWLLVATAAAALWLLIATVVLRVAIRTGREVWGRLRHLRLPTPAQATASSLAGTALLGIPAVTAVPSDIPTHAVTAGSEHHHDPDRPPGDRDGQRQSDLDLAAHRAGIELPGGGWIPYPTALAVTAVSSLIWLHRRQHHRPDDTPRFGQHQHDADLQPLPTAAQAISVAVTAEDPAPPPPPPGMAVLPDLPAGRLTLYGPGAADAARGLLATTILHTALSTTVACRITLRRQNLRLLLNTDVVEPVPDGLEIDHTAVAVAPAPAAIGTDPFLLVTRRPAAGNRQPMPPEQAPPFAVPAEITAVTVSTQPGGPASWYVRTDGTISNAGRGAPRRLCVLTPHAATDLLHLVQCHARSAVPTASGPAGASPAQPNPHKSSPGRLTLLGGCGLYVHGTAVRLRRSAGLQVLAYLAVHPDGATTTDLLRALWPGNSPHTITKRLHTTLTDLRQQLQPMLGEPVVRRHDRYQLDTDVIDSDLHHLRQSITAAGVAFTAHQRRSALQAVVDGYGGELAAGFGWPWLQPAREALRREIIDAYLLLAESADAAPATDLIHAATTVDPYNADLHRRAQAILRAAGDPAAADALHQAYTQRLTATGIRSADTAHRSAR